MKFHTSLENLEIGSTDIVLIDEVDFYMFQDPKVFFPFVRRAPNVVCFTASCGAHAEFLDKQILLNAQMESFNYWPSSFPIYEKLTVDEILGGNENAEVCEEIKKLMSQLPVLLYCEDDLKEALIDAKLSPLVVDEH